ncbi:hypothetical protein FQN49_001537 [Arthroderma sp. PD_2]|nr:hypothetical protein FQN49_001537 [Arthroderma sp. PD_2]
MSYTQMYTLACGQTNVLPTIGSLADSVNRTEDTPFNSFCSSPEAELIRTIYGEVVYQQIVEDTTASREAKAAKAADFSKKLASQRSTISRWFMKLRQAYTEPN